MPMKLKWQDELTSKNRALGRFGFQGPLEPPTNRLQFTTTYLEKMAKRLKLFGITYLVGKISRSNFYFRVPLAKSEELPFHLGVGAAACGMLQGYAGVLLDSFTHKVLKRDLFVSKFLGGSKKTTWGNKVGPWFNSYK